MIEYDYRYKHLQLIAGPHKIIIELSKDNMFKETSYSVKSNLLFLDNDETWGHAVGVGNNEQDALKMCLSEIRNYLNYEFTPILQELDMPKKFTFIYKNRFFISSYFSLIISASFSISLKATTYVHLPYGSIFLIFEIFII